MKPYHYLALAVLWTLVSCATHKRSHIRANEEFVVELSRPQSRGVAEIGLQGLLLGASYLAEKTTKSLTSSYKQSISVGDYYNRYIGETEKSYNAIHIKKYSKPVEPEDKNKLEVIIRDEITQLPRSRGATMLAVDDVIRDERDDMLSFQAVIEIVSDTENPGVSRLSFNELRVFFSKTRVYSDENLNAVISVQIEGQWRDADGSPRKGVLIEQEYDFKNLRFGPENQIKEPILSPWYYDIPIRSEISNEMEFGVVRVNVQMREYEGGKSKYINKLPGLIDGNKKTIVKDGASAIERMF